MYERRHESLAPFPIFIRRVLRSLYMAALVVATVLGVGVLGYHVLEDIPWIDAILNASMILGGMGPVNELHTTAGKLFASAYALFSGIVFIASTGILLAPFMHRFCIIFIWNRSKGMPYGCTSIFCWRMNFYELRERTGLRSRVKIT